MAPPGVVLAICCPQLRVACVDAVAKKMAFVRQVQATLGLANQVLHRRPKVEKGETRSQRQKRESRESLLWLKGVKPLPADRKLVDVCDRGADTSEFIEHEANSGRTFLIRSSSVVVSRHCAPSCGIDGAESA